jgi:hypothetical protein
MTTSSSIRRKLKFPLTCDIKVSGNLSLRRIIEEEEQEEVVQKVKRRHKRFQLEKSENQMTSKIIPNLSKKDIWNEVLNNKTRNEALDRFPNLSLLLKALPVPGILKDLYSFCSKTLHTTLPV